MLQCGIRRHEIKDAIADAAVIFTPSHLVRVEAKMGTSDMMVSADFCAPQAAKETLGLVGTGLADRISERVINAFCQIA